MEPSSTTNHLPKVLILNPIPIFIRFQPEFSRHFHFIKAYESPFPLPAFLATLPADITAMLVTARGIPITRSAVLDHLPSLRCIVTPATGVDFIDLHECRRRRISVTNSSNVSSSVTAELAVALCLDVLRNISAGDRFVNTGRWATVGHYHPLGSRLRGKQVGVVGLGSIGSIVAKRLEAFGCIVMYNSRAEKLSVPYPFYSDVTELAANSDVLVICCALTEQTTHLINKQVLMALGKQGVVINIARGAVIDEEALVKCLVEGQIAGTGLDVFEHQPSVPEELLNMDNVVLSPYLAGFTEESFRELFEHVKGNLLAFFSDKPLLSPVCID